MTVLWSGDQSCWVYTKVCLCDCSVWWRVSTRNVTLWWSNTIKHSWEQPIVCGPLFFSFSQNWPQQLKRSKPIGLRCPNNVSHKPFPVLSRAWRNPTKCSWMEMPFEVSQFTLPSTTESCSLWLMSSSWLLHNIWHSLLSPGLHQLYTVPHRWWVRFECTCLDKGHLGL